MKFLRLIIAAAASAVMLLSVSASASAQDWANLGRFKDADDAVAAAGRPQIVIMGDSITEFWVRRSPAFFRNCNILCRGISGQTTPQMLIRFRHDVVDTNAETVVILAGTNDIAGNTGPSTLKMIVDNIASMCDIARASGIRPVICSVLPAKQYSWKKDVPADELIPQLNAMLKSYAASEKIEYVDFFPAMVDTVNPDNSFGMRPEFTGDGVHPNAEGYKAMEEILLPSILSSRKIRLAEKARGKELKIMSYNIRNCIGMDRQNRADRVAAVINDCNPEVVAVQELDSVTTRSQQRFLLRTLADMTGMKATFASAIPYDGGSYGVGILSRTEPMKSAKAALPGREERRTLLMAEFEDFIFCCTHLSLTKEDNEASVEIIAKAIEEFRGESLKPVYIAGDWNASPTSATLAKISEIADILNDTSVFTFPSDKPRSTIDFIARMKDERIPDARVIRGEVIEASLASDHRPVTVTVSRNR